MASLARRRPIFHSEADFQFALAWELHERHPDVGVRLEYPVPLPDESGEIDIWLRDVSNELVGEAAIELKYWKRKAELTVSGEHFALKERAFKNQYPYDFWKDVARTESLISKGPADRGYIIALTNDSYYWKAGGSGTADEAFRMHERRSVSGTLSWGAASAWDKEPIPLRGRYRTDWLDYSALASEASGVFRYLLLSVSDALETPA